ncbi:MAG TPA: hypothetical protein DF613_04650 [Lachnospiraceae bacterium]|nr:hypothetical protein [Lachnospiraceae bacterium]
MFLNLTNHNSDLWGQEQREAAFRMGGEIMDMPFPAVAAEASEGDIELQANRLVEKIKMLHPDMVLCQGEMTLTHRLVSLLGKNGIRTCAACSERRIRENVAKDETVKQAVFRFVRFREYQ